MTICAMRSIGSMVKGMLGISMISISACVGDDEVTFTADKDGILFVGALAGNDLGETYETRYDATGEKTIVVESQNATVPTVLGSEASAYDFDGDNIYEVEVTADDGNGGTTAQLISVTVTPANDNNPVFTSPNTANVAENTTPVMTVTTTDADLPAQTIGYSISGGADGALFTIDGSGNLGFLAAPVSSSSRRGA